MSDGVEADRRSGLYRASTSALHCLCKGGAYQHIAAFHVSRSVHDMVRAALRVIPHQEIEVVVIEHHRPTLQHHGMLPMERTHEVGTAERPVRQQVADVLVAGG